MTILRLFTVAACAAIVAAAPARAQGAMQGASISVHSGAPIASQMAVGVQRQQNAPTPSGAPVAPRADTRQNRAMMIVGGAALLTGAVVGGDAGTLVSLGGAVVFLWGLYQFLQ